MPTAVAGLGEGTTVFAVSIMLALSTGARAALTGWNTTGIMMKRDQSRVAASIVYESCGTPDNTFSAMHCDKGIQVGECWINARIHNQVFATFEPVDGSMFASREGGPYGTCCAHGKHPASGDLQEHPNPNYFCFAWHGQGKVENALPEFPGKAVTPFPAICPHNLKDCYSDEYYERGGPMSGNLSMIPTMSGLWISPKAIGKGGKPGFLWCNHIGAGCEAPTMWSAQTRNIHTLNCDVSKCAPYKGNTDIGWGKVPKCRPEDGQDCGTKGGDGGSGDCDPKTDPKCQKDSGGGGSSSCGPYDPGCEENGRKGKGSKGRSGKGDKGDTGGGSDVCGPCEPGCGKTRNGGKGTDTHFSKGNKGDSSSTCDPNDPQCNQNLDTGKGSKGDKGGGSRTSSKHTDDACPVKKKGKQSECDEVYCSNQEELMTKTTNGNRDQSEDGKDNKEGKGGSGEEKQETTVRRRHLKAFRRRLAYS